jgi:hypothetical protein
MEQAVDRRVELVYLARRACALERNSHAARVPAILCDGGVKIPDRILVAVAYHSQDRAHSDGLAGGLLFLRSKTYRGFNISSV